MEKVNRSKRKRHERGREETKEKGKCRKRCEGSGCYLSGKVNEKD